MQLSISHLLHEGDIVMVLFLNSKINSLLCSNCIQLESIHFMFIYVHLKPESQLTQKNLVKIDQQSCMFFIQLEMHVVLVRFMSHIQALWREYKDFSIQTLIVGSMQPRPQASPSYSMLHTENQGSWELCARGRPTVQLFQNKAIVTS